MPILCAMTDVIETPKAASGTDTDLINLVGLDRAGLGAAMAELGMPAFRKSVV